ncbi:MAG: hypothetical protein IPK19_29455, partial [Chloroflexi bacterium]|nr:hypothetical protein [Chloroflexota bacterium]
MADVFYRRHFAMEYKMKGKYPTLHAAYRQLNEYREGLENPPLLVVCDIENWEIHTNFPNTAKRVYQFKNSEIAQPEKVPPVARSVLRPAPAGIPTC